jgi:hypothetical protein
MTSPHWDYTTYQPYPASPQPPAGKRRGIVLGVLGLLAGVAAGAVIATTVNAGATTSSGATAGTSGYTATDNTNGGPGYRGLPNSGTVTAVGNASVTIKTSTGTVTYGVTSTSDIDKNGEAQLSDLKVGDAVTFSTQTANGATVIDKLHAGDEAKDRPAGVPAGGANGG